MADGLQAFALPHPTLPTLFSVPMADGEQARVDDQVEAHIPGHKHWATLVKVTAGIESSELRRKFSLAVDGPLIIGGYEAKSKVHISNLDDSTMRVAESTQCLKLLNEKREREDEVNLRRLF